MNWCRTCVLPDTRPNLIIDKDGVCNACRMHNAKREVNWTTRATAFQQIVDDVKSLGIGYDCVIPVSGGKNSTQQVVTCLEAGLKPLAVTWKTPGRTALGTANLENLIRLGVDHIDYQINPEIAKRLVIAALTRFGDPVIPMHAVLFSIPLAIAVRFHIPLIVWGNRSTFEHRGFAEEALDAELDAARLQKYVVENKTIWRDCMRDGLIEKDRPPYLGPSDEELANSPINTVFLSDYFPWDPQVALAVAAAHGFRQLEPAKAGYPNDDDIDDEFMSVCHWFTWYKFGFTRLFERLSLEIRTGRTTRDSALDVLRRRGDNTPHDGIYQLCHFLGIGMDRFFSIAEQFRNPAVWKRCGNTWTIPDFVVGDWDWR